MNNLFYPNLTGIVLWRCIMKEVTLGRGMIPGVVPSLAFRRDVSSIVAKRNPSPSIRASFPVRDLFHALARSAGDSDTHHAARKFLDERLVEVAHLESDLPHDIAALPQWLEQRCARVRSDYRAYLADRHAGQQARYFSCRAHALHFLQSMAPSRMVEGAWLYGFLKHWREARFAPMCRVYLRNLGDGDPGCNQVSLYQKLLDRNGCADWHGLDDQYYVQGAIRLALGHHVDHYLPEIIGFNLGYDQVSLPMLIAAYELSEQGVLPHYFTLHVTEDDAGASSAMKLLGSLLDTADSAKAREMLLHRVNNGYKLHRLGLDIPGIVASFDLQKAFLAVMQPCAAYLERVYRIDCMERGIRGRWTDSLPLPLLLQQLCNEGWMHPDEKGKTRLWQVLERGNLLPAPGYPQQVVVDWSARSDEYGKRLPHTDVADLVPVSPPPARRPEEAEEHWADFNESGNQADLMEHMIRLLSPLAHHTQEGLKAARIYKSILEKGSELYSQHSALFLWHGRV